MEELYAALFVPPGMSSLQLGAHKLVAGEVRKMDSVTEPGLERLQTLGYIWKVPKGTPLAEHEATGKRFMSITYRDQFARRWEREHATGVEEGRS